MRGVCGDGAVQAARGWPGGDRSLQSPAGRGPNPACGEWASARADGSAGRGPGAPSCSAGLGRTAPQGLRPSSCCPGFSGAQMSWGPRGPGPSTSEGVASQPTARTRGRTQGHTATCTRMHTHLYTPVHPDSRWGAPPGKHRAVTCHAPPTSPRGSYCCPTAPTETRAPSGTELVCPTEPVHARTHQTLPLLCPTPSGRGTGYRKEMGRGLPGGGRKRRGGAPHWPSVTIPEGGSQASPIRLGSRPTPDRAHLQAPSPAPSCSHKQAWAQPGKGPGPHPWLSQGPLPTRPGMQPDESLRLPWAQGPAVAQRDMLSPAAPSPEVGGALCPRTEPPGGPEVGRARRLPRAASLRHWAGARPKDSSGPWAVPTCRAGGPHIPPCGGQTGLTAPPRAALLPDPHSPQPWPPPPGSPPRCSLPRRARVRTQVLKPRTGVRTQVLQPRRARGTTRPGNLTGPGRGGRRRAG